MKAGIRAGAGQRFGVWIMTMKVLILNLTRFGDLIQTQPVVSGFVFGGCKVGLLCLENFASVGQLLRGVDWVGAFPGARLLAALERDWRGAVRDFADVRREVAASFGPDLIVNLTPSLPARLLAWALSQDNASAGVRGFSMDEHGFNADTSSWSAFLQLASGNRGASPFNVVDLFRRAAGLRGEDASPDLQLPGQTPDEEGGPVAEAETLLSEALPEGAELSGWLGIQLGASEERRRWPVARFVEAARLFSAREGLTPVLLGTRSEMPLGERFVAEYGGPVVNLMGRTSLPQLAAVLTRLDLLLTNDTGTMHLAAGLGTPVAAIFLATAQPFDTGPYREGSLCFEPDLECHPCAFGTKCPHEHKCRAAVDAGAVHASVAEALFKEPSGTGHNRSGVRVWRTVRGADGLMDLESLSGHGDQDRTRWIALQRRYYRRLFDGESLQEGQGTEEAHGLSPARAERLRKVLGDAGDLVFLLERQAEVLATQPMQAMKNKFLATWQRLQGALRADPDLEVLGLLWEFESQAQGDRLDRIVALAGRYRALMEGLLRALQ
ncbi:MAG: glycosyltransferase family 9 protein [Desulfovibrio sp.]